MKLVEYPDVDLMMMNLADELAGELKGCLLTHDTATFAVPGGTTPGPLFDVLSAVRLDWARVHVLLTDERWVTEDHPRSNTALVRQRLLTGAAAAAPLIRFYDPQADSAAGAIPGRIAALDGHLPISVLLLGMGADMHTASLFPGAEGLAQAMADDAPALAVIKQPGTGETRITLTKPILAGAMSTHIVIVGDEKRRALESAQRTPETDAPVRAVLKSATVHWAP